MQLRLNKAIIFTVWHTFTCVFELSTTWTAAANLSYLKTTHWILFSVPFLQLLCLLLLGDLFCGSIILRSCRYCKSILISIRICSSCCCDNRNDQTIVRGAQLPGHRKGLPWCREMVIWAGLECLMSLYSDLPFEYVVDVVKSHFRTCVV